LPALDDARTTTLTVLIGPADSRPPR